MSVSCCVNHRQFKYADFKLNDKMKTGPMLGVILKCQYPPIIEEKDSAGVVVRRHAFYWWDYYVVVREDGVTAADRVKEEFWVSNIVLVIMWLVYLRRESCKYYKYEKRMST